MRWLAEALDGSEDVIGDLARRMASDRRGCEMDIPAERFEQSVTARLGLSVRHHEMDVDARRQGFL